jgi:hypothetical protein
MHFIENNIAIICLGTLAIATVIYIHHTRGIPKVYDSKSARRRSIKKTDLNEPTIWPPGVGIDAQYQNRSVDMTDRHPVLDYKMSRSLAWNKNGGSIPASVGDIIAPPDIAGPSDYPSNYPPGYGAYVIRPNAPIPGYALGNPGYGFSNGAGRYGAFGSSGGASVDDPRGMGVPVPNGSLKYYNERYNKGQFNLPNPHFPPVGFPVGPSDYRVGLPFQNPPSIANANVPSMGSSNFYRPYGPNSQFDTAPFFGNVNAYSPFPEITSPWEKAGILTSRDAPAENHGSNILNLYRRPIAPLQDLWEYQVQDKDGFVIKLDTPRGGYLEDGDIVHHIIGKEHLGPWKAHIFVQNKYVWV